MTSLWLVTLGAGRWQMSGIKAARDAGLRVLALDAQPDAPGFELADRSAVVDIRNAQQVVEAVLNQAINPAGAASFVTDAGMLSAAAVREAFSLPGPDRKLANRLTDKISQRQAWTDQGLPCPVWFGVSSLSEAQDAIAKIGRKAILKPADSAGSRGVFVFDPKDNWTQAFEAAMAWSPSRRVIIETYVIATEYTVETFAHQGKTWVLAVSEKKKVPGTDNTVASELATPGLDSGSVCKIGELAVAALAALGHGDGPGHTEILREQDGTLWLVESAGRGGGFMVADGIVPRASGFDLAKACALQAVGLEPLIPGNAQQAFVLRFLPTRKGTVTGIRGFAHANALGNVECQSLVAVGDRVEDARTDGGRLAYIFSWAADRATAFALADRAEGLLDISIDQD
ncbi:MAG: ATP-grasp domain-containing protein [Afipia sp.]